MITLTPSPRSLGLHSPVIGPWFSDAAVELPLPDADLAVPLTLDGGVEWRPPAAGFLSFYIASGTRPLGLAHLRGPASAAFASDRLVAVFELLPQAGARLGALMRAIPTLGEPTATGQATRPRVTTFALEFTSPAPDLSFLADKLQFGFPPGVDTDAKKLTYLGLAGGGGGLDNGETPMRDLFRPGVTGGSAQFLMKFPAATEVRLWVFDHRGHAIDPGAAACWWRFLATHATSGFEELFADGVDERTAPIASGADRLTIQLVNAFEGPLTAEELARVQVGGNAGGTDAMRFRGSGSGAVAFSFTAAPSGAPDDFPIPRLGVLPDGRMAESLNLFASGPLDPILVRDHARVTVLSVEHHLTGQPRHADGGAPEPVRTRAADQERASTRILVDRATRPCLLRTPDAVATVALETLQLQDGGSPVVSRFVAPALSLDWGAVDGVLPDVPVPTPVTVTAQALTGGGTEVGGTVAGQRALLTLELGAEAAGAWARCWTQGFDHVRGERFRLDGGSGRADSTGRLRVIVPLADGDATPNTPMGVDVLVRTGQGRRLAADLRFDRPAPIGGTMPTAGAAAGPFLLCEEGREVAALDASAAVASGTHVIALGGSAPALVDPASIASVARAPATLARAASASVTVRLTPPALRGGTAGAPDATLASTGATIRRTPRTLLAAWTAGQPFPGLERRELVAGASTANVSRGVVGGGAAVGDRHGLLPHHDGHPLCPAGPDVFVVGARIEGPALRGVAEYLRERVAESTVDLVTSAADSDLAVPAAPTADSLWIAGLRTVAAGVEAEIGLAQLMAMIAGSGYPFGAGLAAIRTALSGRGITIPAGIDDPAGRVARALDRRFLAAGRGAREGATALLAAIRRAEEFVYLETPALDDRIFGGTDDTIHLLDALITRMDERPGLRVLICAPVFFDVGVPKALQRVRDRELRTALDRLAGGDREARVAVFSPSAGPARTLKLATTTVIVDDAWAMVGTTHLWRRGLSYDSSYAVTVYDDRLEDGRPQEILAFRRQICADRLGVARRELPVAPADLISATRALAARGGFGRLAADRLRPSDDGETTAAAGFTELDVWNPDGSPATALNLITAGFGFTPTAVTEELHTP